MGRQALLNPLKLPFPACFVAQRADAVLRLDGSKIEISETDFFLRPRPLTMIGYPMYSVFETFFVWTPFGHRVLGRGLFHY